MNGVLGRAKIVWIRAGKVILATAACIARCCGGGCPGPVLRRKCDRYCPDTNIAYGFYRIDLDAPIAPGGITWRQWIADNDAALTPCRLIQFGTDLENCYVLDRNCSRCFWSGCNYRLDIPSLPVVPPELINPHLATCAQCLVCDDCCESALINACGQTICRECGSSYRTNAVGHGHSVIQYYTSGPTTPPSVNFFDEATHDYTMDSTHICTATNDACTSRIMVVNWEYARRIRHTVRRFQPGGSGDMDADASESGRTGDGGVGQISPINGPAYCSDMTSVGSAARGYVQAATGILLALQNPLSSQALPYISVTAGRIGENNHPQFSPCSNSLFFQSGGPYEGEYLTDEWLTWNVSLTRYGGTLSISGTINSYQKSSRIHPRYLIASRTYQHQINFTISPIDDCAPDAPNGCYDPLRRKRDDSQGIGNGARDIEGLFP